MLRIGLVGCGTIGTQLARTVDRRYRSRSRIVALHDRDRQRALALQRQLSSAPPVCSLSSLVRRSDLVIEAASAQAAPAVVRAALGRGRSVMVMSTGGLLRDQAWRGLAARTGSRVYLPSGALAALDGVKAMRLGRLRRVTLTTRKPPRALADAPAARRLRARLAGIRRPLLLFEGSPRAVVSGFPQNTNVAATLALACGSAASRVRVRVIADPRLRRNVHELDVQGERARIRCRIESRASRTNPKTSELAVHSALATLDGILNPVVIGT